MIPEVALDSTPADLADDRIFMSRALALARMAGKCGEVPVGAVVVQSGRVIGEGFNQPIRSHDPTAHAEVVALRRAGASLGNYRLPGASLYVTLEPCTMCVGALVHARIERLVFAATEPKAGAVTSTASLLERDGLNHRVQWSGGCLGEAAAELLTTFFARRRGE